MKHEMANTLQADSLIMFLIEFIQVTMNTSLFGVTLSIVLLLAISRLYLTSLSPGDNSKARS